MQKLIIIQPDTNIAEALQNCLNQLPGVLVAGIFNRVADAKAVLAAGRYDAVFAAADLLAEYNALSPVPPLVIAMAGYNQSAGPSPDPHFFAWLDYPFSLERVISVLQSLAVLNNPGQTPGGGREYLFIKSEYRLIKIHLPEILYLSGLRDYTQIYMKGKVSPVTTLQNLKDFEKKLPADNFIRVHRSYIISLGQVEAISRNEVYITGNHTIPIGNAYRRMLDDLITKNS